MAEVHIVDIDGEQWDIKDLPLTQKMQRIEINWKDVFPSGNISNAKGATIYYMNGILFVNSNMLLGSQQALGNGNSIGTHKLTGAGAPNPIRVMSSADLGNITRAGVAFDINANGEIYTYLLGSTGVSVSVPNSMCYACNWTFPVEYLASDVRTKYGI